MDRRLVRAMSTAHDPTKVTTVQRRQRDGTRCPIACPDMIKQYNMQMGGVDHGDQIRGWYRMRTKFHKFYMYIFTFLLDVSITNSFILCKEYAPGRRNENIKDFRVKLANQLIGEYMSRKLPGRKSSLTHRMESRALLHFPTKNQEGNKRGKCRQCLNNLKRTDTPWRCESCGQWLCHSGNITSDCFLAWHKNII